MGPQESRLIAQLSDLAHTAALEIRDFRPGRKQDCRKGISDLELRILCEGSFESLCTFLEELRGLKRLCHIESIKISPLNQSGNKVNADFQVRLLFRQPASTEVARTEVNRAN